MKSNVKLEEITYPYVNIVLPSGIEDISVFLNKAYLYIDEHKNLGRIFQYGNAYKCIRVRANELMHRRDMKISKREVSSLIRVKYDFLKKEKYIKIPYKLWYIFMAVFEIIEELRQQYPLPQDLEVCLNKIRRECFYDVQSSIYAKWFHNVDNRNKLTTDLYNDIFAGNSVLSKRF